MRREHLGQEFLKKYGHNLNEVQRAALSKLGKNIIKEELDRNEIIKYRDKMKALVQYFNKK